MIYELLQSEPRDKMISTPVKHIAVQQVGIQLFVLVKTKGNGWIK
jgi:hypothetical protein